MDPPRRNGCGHGLMETSFDFQRAFHRRTFTLVRLSLSNRRPGAGPRICRTRAALTERTCRPRHGAHQGERMTSHRTDQPSCPAAPAAPFGCWWSAVPTASPGREPVLSRTPGRRHPSDPDSCLRTQSLQGQPRRFGTRMSRRPGSQGRCADTPSAQWLPGTHIGGSRTSRSSFSVGSLGLPLQQLNQAVLTVRTTTIT
jgi:hypothetical protein